MITYRKATIDDIKPALELALHVFMEYNADYYNKSAAECFKKNIFQDVKNGKNLLFIALDGDKIVGVIGNRAKEDEIGILFVDGKYHHQGIAAKLIDYIVCEIKLRGFDKIKVEASPYSLPFYLQYGFVKTGEEQNADGFIYIPLEYTPKEIWDIYDKNRNKTGRYVERGRPMAAGDFHIVVNVWIQNSRGEWLISKRSPEKQPWPNIWESTGGSAIAGDDSLSAALREVKEELGIDLIPEKGRLFLTRIRERLNYGDICDDWVFEHECPIENIIFQEGETCGAKWADKNEIKRMTASGEFFPYGYIDELFEMVVTIAH